MKSKIISIFILNIIYFSSGSETPSGKSRPRRVIGGNIAKENQCTYTVALQRDNKNICSGAIIGDEHIVTAAHCMMNITDFSFIEIPSTVIIGTVDLKNENSSMMKIDVETVYVPRTFEVIRNVGADNSDRPFDDIAILKLRNSMNLRVNKNLKKVVLPTEPYPSYAGIRAMFSGFGFWLIDAGIDPLTGEYMEFGDADGKLRLAATNVISNQECKRWQTTSIYDSDLCAQMRQRNTLRPEGTCYGDSGGPLVYADGNTKFLIGVLSTSPKLCNEKRLPAVYTRVTSYVDFIEYALQNEHTEDMRVATWIVGQCQNTNSIQPIFRELEYCNYYSDGIFNDCIELL